jgi:CubicO group peptidase (beta-lactamase class C family)
MLFSATKGLVALCFLMLHDRGLLDYDAPVATYWPEFAAVGKGGVTVRTLLNHRAGLHGLDRPVSLDDLAHRPDAVAAALAAQRPRWEPGSDQGYHGVTYGMYAQELFRRLTGETLGVFLAREVAGPLGADVALGVDASAGAPIAITYPSTLSERVLQMVPKALFHTGTEGRVYRDVLLGRDAARAFAHPREVGPRGVNNFNRPEVRALELPWANAHGSARGLCRMYAALAEGGSLDGVRLVGAEALTPLVTRQSWSGRDRVLAKPLGWSQGFLKEEDSLFTPGTEGFGHPGAGGALGWCDPTRRLAVGYAPNKMDHRIRALRTLSILKALRSCLDQPGNAASR